MKMTFNPCDECRYGYSKQNQESGTCKICEFKKMLDLKNQWKLLKLPCAVGDTVYSFSCGKILILRVDSFIVYADGIDARLVSDMEEYKFLKVELDITDFGKKWFATHEEAEAALKEL